MGDIDISGAESLLKLLELQLHLLPTLDFRSRGTAALEPISNVVRNVHHRKERQMLKDHIQRALVGRNPQHGAALDTDITAIGLDESSHHTQQRGLATAGRSKNRKTEPAGMLKKIASTAGCPANALHN